MKNSVHRLRVRSRDRRAFTVRWGAFRPDNDYREQRAADRADLKGVVYGVLFVAIICYGCYLIYTNHV